MSKKATKTLQEEATVQVTIRVPYAWRERANALAAKLSPVGKKLSAMDGFRAAMATGFEQLEKKLA